MASVSSVLARYDPGTRADGRQWNGFAPDFLDLMSRQLGFSYRITDERSLCDLTAVEFYRAFRREGIDVCALWNRSSECCALAGTQEYASRDLRRWVLSPFENCTGGVPVGEFNSVKTWICENLQSKFWKEVGTSLRFVYKFGPNKGETLRAHLLLNYASGEHPRTTPLNGELSCHDPEPRTWGDAFSLTPMYTEQVETLVFTTTKRSMWNLFSPFTTQLWGAIIGMAALMSVVVMLDSALPKTPVGLVRSLWRSFATLTDPGQSPEPASTGSHIAVLGYLFFILVRPLFS